MIDKSNKTDYDGKLSTIISTNQSRISSFIEEDVHEELDQQSPLIASDPRVHVLIQKINDMNATFKGYEQNIHDMRKLVQTNHEQQQLIEELKEQIYLYKPYINSIEELKEQAKEFEEHTLQIKNLQNQLVTAPINKLVSFREQGSVENGDENDGNQYEEVDEENTMASHKERSSNKKLKQLLVYDIASLCCCVFRIIFFVCFYTAIIYLWNDENYTFIAVCALGSYILSAFSETLMVGYEGYLIKFTHALHVLGFIPFWIGFFQPLTDFSFEIDMLTSWTIGVSLMILAQLNLLVQINRKRGSKLLTASYIFGIIEKVVLLSPAIGSFVENEDDFWVRADFYVRMFQNPLFIVWPITFLIHLGFLILGLPVLKENMATQEGSNARNNSPEASQNSIIEEETNGESFRTIDVNEWHSSFGKRLSSLSLPQRDINNQTSFVQRSQLNSVSEKSFAVYRRGSQLSILYGVDRNGGIKGELDKDSYTMMMLSHWKFKSFSLPKFLVSDDIDVHILLPYPTKPWVIGLSVFLIQASLGYLIILDQLNTSFDTDMSIPIRISSVVQVGQFITLILALFTQTDILIPFRTILLLWYREGNKWNSIIGEENDSSFLLWFGRVLIPNVLKIVQGILILITTFIIIVQSDHIVGLLKDFTALFVISSVDDLFFIMADYGYLGENLSKKADDAKSVEMIENDTHIKLYLQLAMVAMIGGMLGGWAYVRVGQTNGRYIQNEFPLCPVDNHILNHRKGRQKTFRYFIGDQVCNFAKGVGPNSEECGWEGGDCIEFNAEYPDCDVHEISFIGDGWCFGGEYNVKECGFEGGDCLN